MEDSHSFVYNFGGVHGQGFFSIFDGHAGKHAAEWCGENFHHYLIKAIFANGGQPVPDLLNTTFHSVDARLSQLAQEQGSSSGCTAVTCFLRLEDEDGKPAAFPETGGINPQTAAEHSEGSRASPSANSAQAPVSSSATASQSAPPASSADATGTSSSSPSAHTPSSQSSSNDLANSQDSSHRRHSSSGSRSGNIFSSLTKRIRKASSSSSSSSPEVEDEGAAEGNSNISKTAAKGAPTNTSGSVAEGLAHVSNSKVRRVLYTANVGDARAVLSRRGHAVRLTYDHKASDAQEAKRITDAGGFVMNNRVNAVLAVTRSLGDSAMKEFVVGAPYTTETTLTDEDTFLIVACDGLWDVVEDQDAVDLVREVIDPQEAANRLLNHALRNFSTDNTSVMVIRFNIDGDAYCASARASRKSTQPPQKVQGSHIGQQQQATPTVDSSSALGTTTHANAGVETAASTAESVASSDASNSAQAGSSTADSGVFHRSDDTTPIKPVTSNQSDISTMSNAGSGAS